MIHDSTHSRRRPHGAARVFVRSALIMAAGLIGLAAPGAGARDGTPAVTPATPEKAAAPLPEASEIFERYIEALGGQEKLDGIRNRRITGTYTGDPFQFKASVQVWWEADGRFHQRVSEPAGLRYDLWVVDGMTWSVVMDGEPTPMGGIQRQELLDTADFHGEANYKNRYKEIETLREAKAGDTPVYIVRAVTHAGRPHTLFFAKDSGLLLGNRVPVTGPNGSMRDMTVRVQNYKEIADGVLYPTLFVQDFGSEAPPNRFEFTEIEINVDDEHEYPVPENVRQLFDEVRAAEEAKKKSGG